MNDDRISSVEEVAELIKIAETSQIEIKRADGTKEVYAWITDILLRLKYGTLRKKDKGIVRQYLALYSGYGKSHVDHLIYAQQKHGVLLLKKRTQPTFERVYISTDIALLAEVCEAYQHQNGRALKEVCREMYEVYGDARFVRLQHISVSRLYDLKRTEVFKTKALTYTKTRPVIIPIGERRKPDPHGIPGYLRVDSVHQGDLDREKGVYHIHLVDEVVQWDSVVCVEGISEFFLIPALEDAFEQIPFKVVNFHSDNGSEYINYQVARLLEKVRIEQTKSRARRSNDNALVEGKNAAIIRKYMGFSHIPKKHAEAINTFYREHFNPFVNYHRFCGFPTEKVDERGKVTKVYKEYDTPVRRLLAIPEIEQYLKEGVTKESLTKKAKKQSHLEAAKEMQEAKIALFKSFSAQK